MKKLVLVFVAVVFLSFLVSASGQTVPLYYDYFSNGVQEKTMEYSSVKIEVHTINDSTCRYDEANLSYSAMSKNFDLSAGKLHEKTFTSLGDGIYTYYIKCTTTSLGSEPAEMKLVLRVNSLVSAQIVLSEDPPLKFGRTELTLITSKVVVNAPSLTYSFDGIVYNDLPLFGSEKIWRGYLIIPKTLEDAVVSFRFSANDLEGRRGDDITSQSVFVIDTDEPQMITDIEAIGYLGEVELKWDLKDDGDVIEYNVYRSLSPEVDYTDFYKTVDDSELNDEDVDRGKTYYYRVAGVDEAGNEGDLSKEVYATVLKENASSSSTGLSAFLVGKVENFLVEVDSDIDDIISIKSELNSKTGDEKELVSALGFDKRIESALTELSNLKKDAEKFKLQDLTQEELENKISSLEVKLGVIKKGVPENLIVVDSDSQEEEFGEEDIRKALLSLNSSLSEKEIEKSVEGTLDFVEQSGLRILSSYYNFEVVYIDGSRKEFSLVSHEILGEVERKGGAYFVEMVSEDAAGSSSDITFYKGDYGENSDLVYTFKTDTKEIVYSFEGNVGISRLSDSKLVYVDFAEETEGDTGKGITGYFLFSDGKPGYGGIGLGVLILAGLLVYFVFLKKQSLTEEGKQTVLLADDLDRSLARKDLDKSKEIYSELKEKYRLLGEKEKRKLHKELKSFHELVIGLEIEKNLDEIQKSGDKSLLKKIDSLYESLSEKSKNKVKPLYEKLKKDFGGGND